MNLIVFFCQLDLNILVVIDWQGWYVDVYVHVYKNYYFNHSLSESVLVVCRSVVRECARYIPKQTTPAAACVKR